jgi:hypothetical protein
MIDVLKAFYTIHYNFAALSILLLLLLIFLLTKKNYKWSIIVLAVLVVFNVFLYKRTDGKEWSIIIPPPESSDPYFKPQPKTMTFSVHKDWVIVDEKGEKHHWCWVDDYWDKFANTDVVAWIWGENASKKMMQSTETRAKEAGN